MLLEGSTRNQLCYKNYGLLLLIQPSFDELEDVRMVQFLENLDFFSNSFTLGFGKISKLDVAPCNLASGIIVIATINTLVGTRTKSIIES
jgi:hypothetical protein